MAIIYPHELNSIVNGLLKVECHVDVSVTDAETYTIVEANILQLNRVPEQWTMSFCHKIEIRKILSSTLIFSA